NSKPSVPNGFIGSNIIILLQLHPVILAYLAWCHEKRKMGLQCGFYARKPAFCTVLLTKAEFCEKVLKKSSETKSGACFLYQKHYKAWLNFYALLADTIITQFIGNRGVA